MKRSFYYLILGITAVSLSVIGCAHSYSSSSQAEQARDALLRTIALDKSGVDVDNDSLLRIAYNYYQSRPADTLYARCQYYMGLYYTFNDSTKHALDCFRRAVEASERDQDYYTQYLACWGMSSELRMNNPREALNYAMKSRSAYQKMPQANKSNEFYLILEIGRCYDFMNQPDSALLLLKEALSVAHEIKDTVLIGKAYHTISSLFTGMGVSDSAFCYARKAWNVSSVKEGSLYLLLAKCYLEQDSLAQAEELLKESLQVPLKTTTRYGVYNRLLKIALLRSGSSNAIAYSDSAQAALKQLYYSSEKDNTLYRVDNQQLKTQNTEMAKEYIHSVYWAFSAGLILLVILCSVSMVFWNFRRVSQKKAAMEKERYQLNMELAKQHHDHEMELECIKRQNIQEKQKLLMEAKEKQLSLLRDYILSKYNLENYVDELKKKKDRNNLSDDDWKDMEILLDKYYPGFIAVLKERHPNLKKSEYRDCMLLMFGLNNQELARFYGIALQSVKQRLLKLKGSLNLENKPFSAREYIQNFIV